MALKDGKDFPGDRTNEINDLDTKFLSNPPGDTGLQNDVSLMLRDSMIGRRDIIFHALHHPFQQLLSLSKHFLVPHPQCYLTLMFVQQ